jgi:hypothetical protein
MKKRTNPKIEAMRERSLMLENERTNYERKYSLNEQTINLDLNKLPKQKITYGDTEVEYGPVEGVLALGLFGLGKKISEFFENRRDKKKIRKIKRLIEDKISAEEYNCIDDKISEQQIKNPSRVSAVFEGCVSDKNKLNELIKEVKMLLDGNDIREDLDVNEQTEKSEAEKQAELKRKEARWVQDKRDREEKARQAAEVKKKK